MKTFLIASLALLLSLSALSSSIEQPSNAAVQDKQPSNAAVQGKMPYTFFFTRPEMLGDPNNPTGVRYHSDGKLFAKAMAPRSSLQVRAGGTQRKTPLRAVVTIPSRTPLERSKHRAHGG
jgi:hypothetical protein